MLTPAAVELSRGIALQDQLGALDRTRAQARDEGLELRWIFDIPRQLQGSDRPYWADYTVEAAMAGRDHGVVALGLSSVESGNPPELFAPWFERALGAGLHSVPHAGETEGPDSVWGAVRALGAERIAHGVRAIEDPALVAHLAERAIALDVCPTSNVCLRVYPSLAAHPLRLLHEAGVPVTVNSDDPTMFGTTLREEFSLLASAFELDGQAIEQIRRNAFRHGFDAAAVTP
jgi:adenosine deaminase